MRKARAVADRRLRVVDRVAHLIDRRTQIADRADHAADRAPHAVHRAPHDTDRVSHVTNRVAHASDDAAKVRLKKVRGRSERPDERAQSLQSISQELLTVTAGVPPELVQDAGVTPELSTRLNSYAHAVVSARDTAHEERAGLAAQYDAMNVLDGRILHELRALVGAMSDARKSDKSVPELKLPVLRNRNRKKKKAKVASGTNAASVAAEKPAD